MARAFKEITGNITKLNEPYFAEQRGLWVMMVKENDRWIAINSRDEKKIRDYHGLLETRRTAKTLNITVQPTTLSQEKVKMAEYAFGILGETPAKDIVDAAQLLCQQKVRQQTPMVAEAADLFYEKQSKRQLSEATLRDYRRLVKYLKNEFANKRVGELTSQDITKYIEQPKHPVSQRARFIYLQTFVNFCSGKRNAHCSDSPWITSKILQWEPAKTDFHEISAYSYEEIIAVLKAAKSFDVLPYFIFRLFSLMRTDEFHRFTEIHPWVKEHPLVSIESQRITINAQIFKKRSRNEHRGRFYNNVHPTFLAWLKYFDETDASISCTETMDRKVRHSTSIKTDCRNLLRHTAITYHCLAFKNPLQTAYIAGNSVGIIQNHYLNMNVPEADALKLYELTPQKAKDLGIL